MLEKIVNSTAGHSDERRETKPGSAEFAANDHAADTRSPHKKSATDPLSSVKSQAYEALRRWHVADAKVAAALAVERLRWPAEKLRQEREIRLRSLIAYAKAHSPWHAARLAHIDPATITEAEIRRIPTMTKADLMGNFDAIVTDRRLTLAMVNEHLANLVEDRYLLDSYHAIASSGSSGRRGVFVYDWDGWTECYVGMQRYALLRMGTTPGASHKIVIAQIAADKATHQSSAMAQNFSTPLFEFRRFPVTLPLHRIVTGLNTLQPAALKGYPSMLHLLAREAEAGRLRIAPHVIVSTAEPLFPEPRAAIERAFGVGVDNWWGTSEGGALGMSCSAGPWMHLSDDTLIIEPVDNNGEAVPAGVTSTKLYITNLFNRLMPIIRYEITDQMTLMEGPCPCGVTHRRVEAVQGRQEDDFIYPSGVVAHSKLFTDTLWSQAEIIEYQVRQRPNGADVLVLETRSFDYQAVAAQIAAALVKIGLSDPVVTVAATDSLPRQASGKLSRYIALQERHARPEFDTAKRRSHSSCH